MEQFLDRLKLIAYLYNQGKSKKEIAEILGVSPSTLSNYIGKGYKYNLLYDYYVIPLELLGSPSYIHIIQSEQRVGVNTCIAEQKPDLILYNPIPTPHYFLFYLSLGSVPHMNNTFECKFRYGGEVEETIFIYEDPINGGYIYEYMGSQAGERGDERGLPRIDLIDQMIIKAMFSLYNPPTGQYRISNLANAFARYFPPTTFSYHFYEHIIGILAYRKLVFNRSGGDIYCGIIVISGSMDGYKELVNTLYSKGILSAVFTFYLLGKDPYIGLLLGMCDKTALYNPMNNHKVIKDVFYEIHPLYRVREKI